MAKFQHCVIAIKCIQIHAAKTSRLRLFPLLPSQSQQFSLTPNSCFSFWIFQPEAPAYMFHPAALPIFFFFLHYSYLPFDLHACATLAHWHWTQPSLPSSLPMLLAQYDKNCCLCVHGGHLAAITTLLFSIISHIHIYKIIIRALGCLNFKTNFNKHNHHNKNQFQVVLN